MFLLFSLGLSNEVLLWQNLPNAEAGRSVHLSSILSSVLATQSSLSQATHGDFITRLQVPALADWVS